MLNQFNTVIVYAAPGAGPEFGKASPWALFFVLIILAALIMLLVSMSKHLKKMQRHFAQNSIPMQNVENVPGDESGVDNTNVENEKTYKLHRSGEVSPIMEAD